MKTKLLDIEFKRLAYIAYGNQVIYRQDVAQVLLSPPTCIKLIQLQLIETVETVTKPNKNRNAFPGVYLKCTGKGMEVLLKDPLQLVRVLAQMDIHTYNEEGFRQVVDMLTIEQLPILLINKKLKVRTIAKARIEEET